MADPLPPCYAAATITQVLLSKWILALSDTSSTSLCFLLSILDHTAKNAVPIQRFSFLGALLLPNDSSFTQAAMGHHFSSEHTIFPVSLGLEFSQALAPALSQQLSSTPVKDLIRRFRTQARDAHKPRAP